MIISNINSKPKCWFKKVSKSACPQTYFTFAVLSGPNRWDCKLQLSNSFKSETSIFSQRHNIRLILIFWFWYNFGYWFVSVRWEILLLIDLVDRFTCSDQHHSLLKHIITNNVGQTVKSFNVFKIDQMMYQTKVYFQIKDEKKERV